MEFIFQLENSLPPELCKKIIQYFEEEPIKYEGISGRETNVATIKGSTNSNFVKHKIGTDIKINDQNPKWKDIYYSLYTALDKGIHQYMEYISKLYPYIKFGSYLQNTGFQVQRTMVGERFLWHNDSYIGNTHHRLLTYMWYLNTFTEDECGETMFTNKAIRPVEGKLVIFPATWTYYHQGNIPSKTKYVCIGFIEDVNHSLNI